MAKIQKRIRTVLLGAAGREFHNFNIFFRDNKQYDVAAFTAAQIHGIENRRYPKILAGKLYPKGIPIYPEAELVSIIKQYDVGLVVLAYSDLSHEEVMHKASMVLANGADFTLMGPKYTMLKSKKPVIAVTAVRTGAGKSPASRRVCEILKRFGLKFVVVRHPMPYGDLTKQVCQRFTDVEDLKKENCTIEEMEEYGPHLAAGTVVYSGVDYEKILKEAEKESQVIVWDGGNNDFPFIKPDLHIVVADARRAGHELLYHPGEANLRMADVVIVNKVDFAKEHDIEIVVNNIKFANPNALIIKSSLPIFVERSELVKGKRVLVVEDGPTLTHGGLPSGAASIMADHLGAYKVNPRSYAVGSIKNIYNEYPHLGAVLPAMGYSRHQMEELEQTINSVPCDIVMFGTPVDLKHFLNLNKPAVRVRYELKEIGRPNLEDVIEKFLKRKSKLL